MKLSFVVPAYNEEDYIGDCLESILRETKGKKCDFEIIVVNNASTDNTKKIALSFKGVKVIDEPRKGLVRARTRGYKASTGDLVANIDSDTRLTKGWVDTVVNEFTKNKKLAGLSGPFIYYDLTKKMKILVRTFYYYTYAIYLFSALIIRTGSVLQGGNYVFKRTAFDRAGGFNEDYDFYGEDADVSRRLFKQGPIKWTFMLPIFASGRRLAKEGPTTTCFRYTLNYFWTYFFKKPFTKTEKDIRFSKINKVLHVKPDDMSRELASSVLSIAALILFPAAVLAFIYRIITEKIPQLARNIVK
jgi:glycosyltransferase involved in cell wall biosynthesis